MKEDEDICTNRQLIHADGDNTSGILKRLGRYTMDAHFLVNVVRRVEADEGGRQSPNSKSSRLKCSDCLQNSVIISRRYPNASFSNGIPCCGVLP